MRWSLVASKWANRHTWSNISQCNVSGTEWAPKSTTKVWGFWLNRGWKSMPELLWQQPCEPYWTVWGYINHVFWVFTHHNDSSRVCAPHAFMIALLKCPLASTNLAHNCTTNHPFVGWNQLLQILALPNSQTQSVALKTMKIQFSLPSLKAWLSNETIVLGKFPFKGLGDHIGFDKWGPVQWTLVSD